MSRGEELRRAAPTLLKVGLSQAVAYRSEFLVWVLATNMPLVMLLLWTAVAKEAPVGRFGEAEFGAYFLATLVVRLLTGSWVVWELNFEIRQGTIGMRLLRPIHPFLHFLADNVAAMPLRALVSLPVAVAALLWLGSSQLTRDPLLWALVPVAILGAFVITFFVGAAIGSLGLWWQSSISVFELWLGLFFVFSGYILPLELLPPWLYAAAKWMPFRYVLSYPVELMLGLVDRQDALAALAAQLAWCAISIAAAGVIWRKGLRRYAAYGG